jgi:hypothetical protein
VPQIAGAAVQARPRRPVGPRARASEDVPGFGSGGMERP